MEAPRSRRAVAGELSPSSPMKSPGRDYVENATRNGHHSRSPRSSRIRREAGYRAAEFYFGKDLVRSMAAFRSVGSVGRVSV